MKKWIALVLALTLALSLVACAAEEPSVPTGQTEETESHPLPGETTEETFSEETTVDPVEDGLARISVTVVHADGSIRNFSYDTGDKYLGMVLQGAGLIKGNAGPYGLEITEVDGEKAVYETDKAYWAIYVGEEYALTGVDSIEVENGGSYKLEYTRG